MRGDFLRRTGAYDFPASRAALGSQIDNPVGGRDHIEVVFNHDQGVSVSKQPPERLQQRADVIEVQSRGGLVEQEQGAERCYFLPRPGEMTGKFQAL